MNGTGHPGVRWLVGSAESTTAEGPTAPYHDNVGCRLQVTQLFTGYVGSMLQEYAAAPAANWKVCFPLRHRSRWRAPRLASPDHSIRLVYAPTSSNTTVWTCTARLSPQRGHGDAWTAHRQRSPANSDGVSGRHTDSQAKDCAVFLVTALAARTRTVAAGAAAVNELVNIVDFYRSQIAPDLQATGAEQVCVNAPGCGVAS